MPFQTTPEIDFASVGLVTDIPSHSVPQGGWTNSLNLRCKDGTVQGVNIFEDDVVLHDTNTVISGGKARAVTQFTPAGSNYLVIAYIVEGTDSKGHVVTYDTNTSTYNDITNSATGFDFTFDDNYPPQIFVFNELLIVNPAVDAPPQYTDATIASGSLNLLPGWLSDSTGSYLVTRILRPFGNRLMAMNILEEHTAATTDDVILPIDMIWSTHITGVGSLPAASWLASTVNTAGDAFAVDTPGKILDGGQLGSFFIAYKSDSVIRVSETGDNLVLSFESIFEDDGIYSNRCFANIGNSQHLVVGNYGVYMHDGQSQKSDIAKGIFQETLFALVKPAEKDRAFCFQQTRDKEVWFCFPSTSNSGDGCDLAFVYDYQEQKLHKRSLPGLTDIFETEMNGELKIYAAKPGDTKLQVLSNTLYEADGFFVKEDDNMQQQNSIKQANSIYINSEGNIQVDIIGTQSLGATKNYSLSNFTTATDYKVDTRATGRYMNIKFQMNGSTNPKLGKIQLDIKPAGTR